MSDTIAVKESEIEVLVGDLTSLNTNITKCLNDMSGLMADISSSIEGEVADSIKGKFSELELQFPLIIENMESYAQDFKNLSKRFVEQDSSISVSDITVDKGGEIINVKY